MPITQLPLGGHWEYFIILPACLPSVELSYLLAITGKFTMSFNARRTQLAVILYEKTYYTYGRLFKHLILGYRFPVLGQCD